MTQLNPEEQHQREAEYAILNKVPEQTRKRGGWPKGKPRGPRKPIVAHEVDRDEGDTREIPVLTEPDPSFIEGQAWTKFMAAAMGNLGVRSPIQVAAAANVADAALDAFKDRFQ